MSTPCNIVYHPVRKVAHDIDPENNTTQVSCLKVLGVTLQSNHRFNEHIKVNLQEAKKCLYVIRCLRKEGYQQSDVHYVFRSIVLPKLMYGLPPQYLNYKRPRIFYSAALNANTFPTKILIYTMH